VRASLRCCCGRCAGGVSYLSVADYLADHQLRDGEYVLDSEVELRAASRAAHPSNLASIDRRP